MTDRETHTAIHWAIKDLQDAREHVWETTDALLRQIHGLDRETLPDGVFDALDDQCASANNRMEDLLNAVQYHLAAFARESAEVAR